jgi:cytosine/adenosine deaminase-related metal-dependent hydrolase
MQGWQHVGRGVSGFVLSLLLAGDVVAQATPAPDRRVGEGDGPHERLIIRGATVIDGTGAPPRGPMDIVIEGNRIVEVRSVGYPGVPIEGRPEGATREIDAHGSYVLPGFVDVHMHVGGAPKNPDAEYVYKLWMAHGITTAVGVGFGPHDWTLSEQARSARNEIVAPRIVHYLTPGSGWDGGPVQTPEQAREWVRWAARNGVQGLKLGFHSPHLMEALLDEARRHDLGSTAHLAQTGVAEVNALDAARLGLSRLTHFYGIFEALYANNQVQPFRLDYNYNDEQIRFSQVAEQWSLVVPRGSERWNALIDEFLQHRFILDPTMTAYLASRDVMRARNADWHERYTLPSLWEFYQPSRTNHGSYYWDWTTGNEVAWRNFYRVWMDFLNDYKNAGGRVTVSSDAGFIYNLYGFSSIEEMELLQEAGFHPLEVIRGATLHAAQAIFEPMGRDIEFGVIRPGLLADLVIVDENPIQNLKVLYGTGHVRLNDETGRAERVGGVRYTIKDGVVYDAKQLLADVARMVEDQKRQRGIVSLRELAPEANPF